MDILKRYVKIFPILSRTVYGKPLVYFDNGATLRNPVWWWMRW